MYCNIDLR